MKKFVLMLLILGRPASPYKLSDFSQAFLETLGFVKPKPKEPNLALSFRTPDQSQEQLIEAKAELYDLFLKTEYLLSKSSDGTAKTHSDLLVNISKTSQAYQTHAKALFQCGQFEQISQVFNKIKIQDCIDSDFWLMSAKAFMSMGIESKADEIMSMALERFPDKEQVVYQKILFEVKKDNFSGATQLCKDFLSKATPKAIHHIFYELLAITHLKIDPEAHEQVFTYLNKALELNPKSTSAYNTKIMILESILQKNPFDGKKKKLLIETLKEACQECQSKEESAFFVKKLVSHNLFLLAYRQFLNFYDKKSAQEQVNACFLAFNCGQKLMAIKHAVSASECEPNNDSLKALIFKLILSLDNQSVPESIAKMLASHSCSKSSLANMAKKALLHLAVNTKDQNLEKLLTSKLSTKNPSDKLILANLSFSKKHFLRALEQYLEINQILPRGSTTAQFRAGLWLSIALSAAFTIQLNLAHDYCSKVLEIDSSSWTAKALMGVICAALGQADRAIEYCHNALLTNPFHQEAQEALCWALSKKGKLLIGNYWAIIFGLQNKQAEMTLTRYLRIMENY